MNLSHWSVAFNGSEPIRPQTIDRFVAAFEPFGFRRDAFSPCYGLAEATLLVSGGNSRSEPLVMKVLPQSLNGHHVLETEPGEQGGHALAASGRVQLPQRVIIADPQTLTRLSGNEVGEIWLTGPCVAAGYYNRLEETTKTFRAYLADSGDGPFLRTGDLGFVKDGELFVTGRLKDLMIFRGQNYYPADIETTVQRLLAPTRQQWGAAFSIGVAGDDRLVIVQEISGPHARGLDEIIDLIRQSVAEEHGLPAYAVALVRPGTVPRTSSGKVRRLESRDQFIEGKLRVLAEWREPSEMFDVSSAPASIPTTVAEAELWLACLLAERLGVSAGSVDVTVGLSRYGLDSVRAVDLGHVIEKRLGITLSMNALLCADSITQLAETIVVLLTGSPSLVPDPRPSGEDLAEFDLSAGQQALYFVHQLADAPINNIAAAGRIPGAIDAIALRAALQAVVDRHPSLRTNFVQKSAGLRQRVKPDLAVHLQETDATQWTAETLTAVILEESNRRFDLEYDQLLRVTIYKRNEESW
ncbi:MAG: condensation domain-containing protein, partial [Blastocatellia bacterium]